MSFIPAAPSVADYIRIYTKMEKRGGRGKARISTHFSSVHIFAH